MQTNSYKGSPPRAWLPVRLIAPDGHHRELDLLADTGNPFSVIVAAQIFEEFKHRDGPGTNTNFDPLRGGVLCLSVPELRENLIVIGYGSDAIARAARSSDLGLDGLVGLPFLRNFRYGGDADEFWIA